MASRAASGTRNPPGRAKATKRVPEARKGRNPGSASARGQVAKKARAAAPVKARAAGATRARSLPAVKSRPSAPRTAAGAAAGDGRHLRAERNRDAVVTAVLAIVRERKASEVTLPGAAAVAKRAGVSERTVFRHFADLDSLFLAAVARQRPVHENYVGPRPDAPAVADRLAALVQLRSKLYEQIAPVRRVAVHLAATQPLLAAQLDEAHLAARKQVVAVFAPELKALSPRRRQAVVDGLDVALGWSTWERLRSQLGYAPDRARRVVIEIASALLAPTPETAPARRGTRRR